MADRDVQAIDLGEPPQIFCIVLGSHAGKLLDEAGALALQRPQHSVDEARMVGSLLDEDVLRWSLIGLRDEAHFSGP